MSNNNGFNLEDVLEDPKDKADELQKQIDEKDKKIFQMKQEQKYYEKTINESKNTIARIKATQIKKKHFKQRINVLVRTLKQLKSNLMQ